MSQQSGLSAKRHGELFEKLFESTCARQRVVCTRMPDGCRQVGAFQLIRVKTPWDFVLSFEGKTALIDTKTRDGATFGNSEIEGHQAGPMGEHERAGTIAGYVIWLRGADQVIFVPASVLLAHMGHRGSIGLETVGIVKMGASGDFKTRKIFQTSVTQLVNNSSVINRSSTEEIGV